MKFKLKDGEKVRTTLAVIADGTVVEAGDLVGISSGLIIKATAGSTMVAWAPAGHASGDGTSIEVSVDNDFTLIGTMDVVFAAAYRGVEYDLNTTTQTIDQGGTTTKVLKVGINDTSGVVGTAAGVEVRINKPLF